MRKSIKLSVLILSFFFIQFALWAESFYNIKGFYGERDTGLGGAYSAISDDPAGILYNPAGMAFSYYDSITTTSINYNYTEKEFKDVLGPSRILGSSQNYVRQSKGLNPSFIGVMQNFGTFRFGIAIFNPIPRSIDQFNNATNPVAIRDITEAKVRYREEFNHTTAGPSLAWKVSEKVSVGLSLLGFMESNKISYNATLTSLNGNFVNESMDYHRNNMGQISILGFMYQASNTLSFGFSLKKNFHVSGKERSFSQSSVNSVSNAAGLIFEDSSSDRYGAYLGSDPFSNRKTPMTLMGNPRYTGRIPELEEIRTGVAYYPNRNFLISTDIIYTSGYSFSRQVINYDPQQKYIIFYSRSDKLLKMEPTLNLALGTEIYLFDFLSFRFGIFTNKSNLKHNTSRLEALGAGLLQALLGEPGLRTNFDEIQVSYYFNGLLDPEYRNEYADLLGYSLGFAYETTKTTIGLNLTLQKGTGFSQLLNQVPVDMHYQGSTLYLTTSIKN